MRKLRKLATLLVDLVFVIDKNVAFTEQIQKVVKYVVHEKCSLHKEICSR